jgi:hypothetical protein
MRVHGEQQAENAANRLEDSHRNISPQLRLTPTNHKRVSAELLHGKH